MTNDDLPNGWEWGIGEGNRPLSDGGYYLHLAYRVLPGSNQSVERYLEMRIDTVDMAPTEHYLELNEMRSDNEEIREIDRLATDSVRVDDPESEAAQKAAEQELEQRAVELMEQYPE